MRCARKILRTAAISSISVDVDRPDLRRGRRRLRRSPHKDCVLWVWTTNHHMREALRRPRRLGVRAQDDPHLGRKIFGKGDWLRGQTEHVLMATRGRPIVQLLNQSTLFYGQVRKNSRKPEEFYAFVEGLCPAPRYAELFSRRARPNWDGHGDELRPVAHQPAPPARQTGEAEHAPTRCRRLRFCFRAPSRPRNAGAGLRRRAALKYFRAPPPFASPPPPARRNYRRPGR